MVVKLGCGLVQMENDEREGGMTKRSPTTKDIGLLHQLFSNGQLTLAPEFQRNSVWPNAAKAYLIDTILNDRPIAPSKRRAGGRDQKCKSCAAPFSGNH